MKSLSNCRFMKRTAAFLLSLCLMLCLTPAFVSFADTSWPDGLSISADGGILIDARSGAIIYGKNIDEVYFPASITKILTALIVIENCDLDDMVTFSNRAVNSLEANATIVGARAGDKMSVRDCLYALLLQSANEVANALAEHVSGSIEAFCDLMNRRAEELGCKNSHFTNPSGLNDEDHYTTPYDMALISMAAFANPTFREIDSTTYYDVQPGELKQYPDGWRYYAHHQMLRKNNSLYYEGIIGGKTGYTTLAGNTLVTCAERDGLRLIAVILNGHLTHYEDTKAMLDFGFKNFQSVNIADRDNTYESVEDDLLISGIFPGTSTQLALDRESYITLPINGDITDVSSSMTYDIGENAPDNAVARIDYTYGDKLVGQAYLEAVTSSGYEPGMTELVYIEDLFPEIAETEDITFEAETEEEEETPGLLSRFFALFLKILPGLLIFLAVIAVIALIVYEVISARRQKEAQDAMLRREARAKRRQEWGYTSADFNKIIEGKRQRGLSDSGSDNSVK